MSTNLGGKTTQGNATSSKVSIAIADIPTEETSLIIKLTAQGMKEFTKILTVKKDLSNTQPNEFKITSLKLWGHDVKTEESVVVTSNDEPKALEVGVANCASYSVSVTLNEQTYQKESSVGFALLPISDIPLEEKTLIIKLTATEMKDFTKTIKVKKDDANAQLKEFEIAKMELWGRDIKEKDSIVVSSNDEPKQFTIDVANCPKFELTLSLEGENYTDATYSGHFHININDISTEEEPLTIKLTALGMKDFTKTIKVKKDDANAQLQEFKLSDLQLWGHNIIEDDEVVVSSKDEVKYLYISTNNCKKYTANVNFDEKEYEKNVNNYYIWLDIGDIPTEEKTLTIKLTALGMKDFTKTIKVKKDDSNAQLKDFNIYYLKLWGRWITNIDSVAVVNSDKPKNLEIKVFNAPDFTVDVNFNGKDYHASSNSSTWIASIEIDDIPMEEKLMVIKLEGQGMKPFTKIIRVKRELEEALDLEVSFNADDVKKKVEKGEEPTFNTKMTQGKVVITSQYSLISKAFVNKQPVTLSQDKTHASFPLSIESDLHVFVEVEFSNALKAERTFNVKKFDEQGQIPFGEVSVNIFSGNYNKTILKFNSKNEASVELDDIQYSCVKLVMQMNQELQSAELEECRDQRSAKYSTEPTNDDYMGIYSGRLKGEEKDGVLKEFTTIEGKTYTERLIVGYGTVEYNFKLKSITGDEKTYKLAITNKNTEKLSTDDFNFSHNYGDTYYLSHSHYWLWSTYSMLPLNKEEALSKVSDLEYMGDDVRMRFLKLNNKVKGDMYFYYNIYSDASSKKHEFVRIAGREVNDRYYLTYISIDPKESFVDAFIGCKDFLPHGLLPQQTAKKWKKILNKGFMFTVHNDLSYKINDYDTYSNYLFYQAFNYRVQAKTYEAKGTLNIGIDQEYEDLLTGEKKSLKETPFLSGMEGTSGANNEKRKEDIFAMYPTFSGDIASSIETISYTIQKNKEGSEAEFEDVEGWKDVSLTPSKWKYFLVVNAKDEAMKDGKLNLFPQNGEKNMYTFLKGDAGNENIYKIIVKIKPKNSEEEVFTYKINYRGKESVSSLSLGNKPSKDATLFGLPVSYQESLSRETLAIIREAEAQDFLRQWVIAR